MSNVENIKTMDENILVPIGVLGTIGTTIILFVRTLTDYILKKKMIEKGLIGEDAMAIFRDQTSIDNKYSSLKWGLIIFFGGLSLIIMEYIPYHHDSTLPYGLFLLSISLGFLIYYFLIKKDHK
jgi:hypothetical protein